MPRLRSLIVALCFVLAVLALVPGAALARGAADPGSATVGSEPAAGRFVRSATHWGQELLSWMQVIVDFEHGSIVPGAPTDPPDPTDPPPPPEPEDPNLPVDPAP